MSDDTAPKPKPASGYEYPRIEPIRKGVGKIRGEPIRITRDPVTGELHWTPAPE